MGGHRLGSEFQTNKDGDSIAFTWVWLAISSLSVIPIWLVQYPPLVDYPNHLARCYILFHLHNVPEYHKMYTADWSPAPNLGLDLLCYVLQCLFDVSIAGKIALTITVVLFCCGAILLSHALWKKVIWGAPIVASFAINSYFLYGFVNYCLGLAFYMCLLAIWLQFFRRKGLMLFALTVAFAVICYIIHLSAYVCFATSIISYLVVSQRRDWTALLYSILLLLVFFLLSSFSETQYGAKITWNSIAGKTVVLFSPIRTYNWRFDAVVILTVIVTAFVLVRSGRPVLTNGFAILNAIVLLVQYLALPKEMASVSGVDARFVLPAFVLLLLSTDLSKGGKRNTTLTALLVLYCAALVRGFYISKVWVEQDTTSVKYASLFSVLPRGSWVFPITHLPKHVDQNKKERTYVHFVHYSTIQRKTFSPTLFTIPGQQPLRRLANEPYVEANATSPEQVDWQRVLERYDYLWCYDISADWIAPYRARLRPLRTADRVAIYEVVKLPSPPPPPRPSPSGKARDDSPTRADPPSR